MISILLDDSLDPTACSYVFQNPLSIITAHHPHEVDAALSQIETALAAGHYVTGFFAYELGYILEPALQALLPSNLKQPLLWFGVFKKRQKLTPVQTLDWIKRRSRNEAAFSLENMHFSLSQQQYQSRFEQVKNYIAAGDIYQLNLTFKAKLTLKGSPYPFYQAVRQNQAVHYGAFIDAPDFKVLSFSPEQFITLEQGKISTRPMKGTMKRGQTRAEDQNLCKTLFEDDKNRAENLMIVDLMRNDLAKIAQQGSVKVEELYKIEAYKTLFQMTSLVTAQVQDDRTVKTFIKSLFPAGSIIGAPKIRAQQIIAKLETEPRGVYTGSIGYFSPNGDACFNVAIRTIFLDAQQNGEIGIGAGLVSDSEVVSEYDECLLKMAFLQTKA